MKKSLLFLLFLLFSVTSFAQQFSLYNTGTLYDSFENPSQKAFISDTSKEFSSNFFFPNFNTNFFLSGDAQASLKSRAFLNKYNNSLLLINQGKYNTINENANAYIFMIKMFNDVRGDEELGFSWQVKSEGKGLFSDESVAAFNGTSAFTDQQTYNNIFNDNYTLQSYHQFSFTYHEKIGRYIDFGVKLSALFGIQYQKLNITQSQIIYNKTADTAHVGLAGTYREGFVPGNFTNRDYLPNARSPGAAISIGATYRTEDEFIIQGNIKDLGFIHWSNISRTYNFNDTANIHGLSTPAREDSIYNKVYHLIHNNPTIGSFTTPIDGRAELSVSKSFFLDDDQKFKYSPTLIASKELFYQGFIAALVNPVQYKQYSFTLTGTYNDLKEFNLGAQFKIQKPYWEVYIGSDKLTQTISFAGDAINKNSPNINQNSSFTGASFFFRALL